MKSSVLLATTLVAFAGIASAAPLCTGIGSTMADYLALGSGGCTIGDKLFSNFTFNVTFFGTGADVPAADVSLAPVGAGTSNPGILFSSNAVLVPGADPSALSYVDLGIGFTVSTVDGRNLIEDATLTLSSFAVSGTGRANIGETVTPGSDPALLLAVDSSGPFVDHTLFTPTNTVSVLKDVIVSVLPSETVGSGTAQIFSFQENFSQIPEPIGSVLIGSGLLALGIWRRRVSRRG